VRQQKLICSSDCQLWREREWMRAAVAMAGDAKDASSKRGGVKGGIAACEALDAIPHTAATCVAPVLSTPPAAGTVLTLNFSGAIGGGSRDEAPAVSAGLGAELCRKPYRLKTTDWRRSTRCWRQPKDVWINKPIEELNPIVALPSIQAA
jgi:hypothetical protein